MGGGGTKTETQTSGSTNPMVDTTVTKLLTGLGTQVDKGTAVFDKSLYAGMSDTTKGGINALVARANEGQPGLDAAYGWANNTVANGGYNAAMTKALSGYQGVANAGGYNSALRNAEKGYQSVADAGGYNQALTQAQSGVQNYLKESQTNAPGYAALRQRGIDDALTGVGSSFLTDGRFGSSAMGDAAGEAASDVALGYDYQNYTDRLGRQLQGNEALAGIGQTALGNRMGALSGVAGVGQTAMGNQMGALSGVAGLGQSAMANAGGAANSLPGFANARLQPAQMQIAAGQMLDADAQARLQGENDLFRRTNDAGWSTLGQASSILAGNAAASTQQSSVTTPTAPMWQQLLGYVAGNAGKAFGAM